MRSLLHLLPSQAVIELRPYQQKALADVELGWSGRWGRQVLVSPTGSGKTVMFSWLARAESQAGRRVVILAHRAEILDQISESLTRFGVEHGEIRAGLGMDVTRRVLVGSIQTVVRRFDRVPTPDLVIIDECHHATSGGYAAVFARWPEARYLGVTATPERLDGRGLREYFGRMILGPTTADLIAAGALKRPRVFAPPVSVDVAGIKRMGGDFERSELAQRMQQGSLVGDTVEHYRRHAAGRPAIGFGVSLAHAEHLAKTFWAGGFPSEVIHGGQSREQRQAAKARLASGETQVLMSCDLVSEGFDLPSVACAILCRPTASLGLYLQQVGRALRPSPGYEDAIILDHAGNTTRHGMPTEDRKWSLDGDAGAKRPRAVTVETRQCGKCFAVYCGQTCPECGSVRESAMREIDIIEGELQEVQFLDSLKKRDLKREVSQARTITDLLRIQTERGYKSGWAFAIHRSRQRNRRNDAGVHSAETGDVGGWQPSRRPDFSEQRRGGDGGQSGEAAPIWAAKRILRPDRLASVQDPR